MDTKDLESRWQSISHKGASIYRSLRISATCKPELYVALDIKGNRFLILQVPDGTAVNCRPVELKNLSLAWHAETRLILIGLLNSQYSDLFNDLTLNLYNLIKDSDRPDVYTAELIGAFHKWSGFFEDSSATDLSESFLKGLFGELTVLNWYLANDTVISPDHILAAWQGPFNRPQDFAFPGYNLEVKTKITDEVIVAISSEYQLRAEPGKGLLLGVVNVDSSPEGMTLQQITGSIKSLILAKGIDLQIFLKMLTRSGLNYNSPEQHNMYKWIASSITMYDCRMEGFPKITSDSIPAGTSQVKYLLNTSLLEPFCVQTITL